MRNAKHRVQTSKHGKLNIVNGHARYCCSGVVVDEQLMQHVKESYDEEYCLIQVKERMPFCCYLGKEIREREHGVKIAQIKRNQETARQRFAF